jgi:hypothetical protein
MTVTSTWKFFICSQLFKLELKNFDVFVLSGKSVPDEKKLHFLVF